MLSEHKLDQPLCPALGSLCLQLQLPEEFLQVGHITGPFHAVLLYRSYVNRFCYHIRQDRIPSKLQTRNSSNGGEVLPHFSLSSLPRFLSPKRQFPSSIKPFQNSDVVQLNSRPATRVSHGMIPKQNHHSPVCGWNHCCTPPTTHGGDQGSC